MRLKSLGGLGLEGSSFQQYKPLLLLCYLALEGKQSRRLIADLFWMDAKDPRDALSTAMRRLRKIDTKLLVVDKDYLSTELDCDAKQLLTLLDACQYEKAIDLYEGPLVAGLDLGVKEELEEWIFKTREYLAARVREAHLKLAEQYAQQKDSMAAAQHAELAYGLVGTPELEPEDYQRLYEHLYLGKSPKASDLKREADGYGIAINIEDKGQEKKSKTKPIPNNLPSQTTSFIGRDPERLEIAKRLAEPHCRLLSIHGPGGIGKTRLAIQAAYDLLKLRSFEDGIYFVGLEALTEVKQIPVAIANSLDLNLHGSSNPLEQVSIFLNEKKLLIILDNYEHLLLDIEVISLLLQRCSNLKLLVTTRERLNLTEEHVLNLEGLTLPTESAKEAEYVYTDAVQLFTQRAKKVSLSFEIDQKHLKAVKKICNVLEGSPLGIELASALVRLMPVSDIAEAIEKNIDFLVSSSRNQTKRHQSLRAVFDYSWTLLSEKEQAVLRKLSVFRGGFRREAASEVAGATLPSLAKLVDKSLLRVSSKGRYELHPLIYQFTLEKFQCNLNEKEETYEKYSNFFLYHIKTTETQFKLEQKQSVWLNLEEEYENLKTVLTWTIVKKDIETGLRIAVAVSHFWSIQGYFSEGRYWFEKLLAELQNPSPSKLISLAYIHAGTLAHAQGDYEVAKKYQNQGLFYSQHILDQQLKALALGNLGVIAKNEGNLEAAQTYYQQSLSLLRALNDDYRVAQILNNLGDVARKLGDFESSKSLFEESLAIKEAIGDPSQIAYALYNLGLNDKIQGNLLKARINLEKSLVLRRKFGSRDSVADSLNDLAVVVLRQGDLSLANTYFEESLLIRQDLDDKLGLAISFEDIAEMYLTRGRVEESVQLWGAANKLREDMGAEKTDDFEHHIEQAKGQLGEHKFYELWQKGSKLTLGQVINLVIENDPIIG